MRTVVVTGASAGIGAAIARRFGAEGWRVAIGARREDRLAAVAQSIAEAGGEAFPHALDVTNPDSIGNFFSAAEARFGALDAVVNNAGISIPGLLHELEPEDVRIDVTTNLLGAMWVAQRAIPSMRDAGFGDLVFIGSDNAERPRPFQTSYSAAKAGVKILCEALAMELEGTGVRVTNLRLGPTASEFGTGWDPAMLKRVVEDWAERGILRSMHAIDPEVVADVIAHAIETPRGSTLASLELQPTEPV